MTRSIAAPMSSSVPYFPADDIEAIARDISECLENGSLRQAPHRRLLEKEIAAYTKVPHVLAVTNGSMALEAIFSALGVGSGDEVIVPTNTFIASAAVPARLGASIKFVDMDGSTVAPTAKHVEDAITERTKAVVIVYMGGYITPAVREIAALCDARGIPLIEDAAHATGATLDGVQAGHFGIAAIHSLYPTKVLTCGEGGLVLTRDRELAHLIDRLREQGRSEDLFDVHDRLGTNYRMSELQAIVARYQFRRVDEILEKRRAIAHRYNDAFRGLSRRLHRFAALESEEISGYKYWLTTTSPDDVKRFREHALERGVDVPSGIQDYPCHHQPVFRHLKRNHPGAERFCYQHVCLPIYPDMTTTDVELVIDAVLSFDELSW